MSQTILPPSPQPDPQPPAQLPEQAPTYYYPANDTSAVIVSEPPTTQSFEPDPPKKQPLLWRIIKWPIRQVFKLIYVIVRGMRNHKVISAILLILILALVGAGVVGYRYLNPPSPTTSNTPAAASNAPDTPFTVLNSSQPPLSAGVIHWLHAYKTFNGQEEWDSLSPTYQQSFSGQGINASAMQSTMDQIKSQGITFEEFIYTGGYIAPSQLATYTVQVVIKQNNQLSILTWYFYVDGSSDLILAVLNLTPGSNG